MSDRQIVIISGKTCSGKTGLATLLEKEFGFFVVRTRELLAAQLELAPSSADRQHLIEQGLKQNVDTRSRWVVLGVLAGLRESPQTSQSSSTMSAIRTRLPSFASTSGRVLFMCTYMRARRHCSPATHRPTDNP